MLKAILIAVSMMGMSAFAGDVFFKSPSGNILCQGSDDGVECLIINKTNTAILPKPKDCDLDWGGLFGVSNRGRAYLSCYSDAFDAPDMKVLNYGKSIRGEGWQCISQRTGMTCKNQQGHGFNLRRSQQTLF